MNIYASKDAIHEYFRRLSQGEKTLFLVQQDSTKNYECRTYAATGSGYITVLGVEDSKHYFCPNLTQDHVQFIYYVASRG